MRYEENCFEGVQEKMEDTIEQTIKKLERLSRILTVIVIVELVALLLFL
jgi:hypothetical protein